MSRVQLAAANGGFWGNQLRGEDAASRALLLADDQQVEISKRRLRAETSQARRSRTE
jgi:hypothetical protein